MMNNYEKLKTLCHQNYIGSEKCGGCGGKKYISEWYGDKEDVGLCIQCDGKGYIIPLEFGCEVKISSGNTRIYSILSFSSEDIDLMVENLGKTLTLQDVLRLLSRTGRVIEMRDNHTIHIGDYSIKKQFIKLDLTKEPKDWSEETWGELLELVKE